MCDTNNRMLKKERSNDTRKQIHGVRRCGKSLRISFSERENTAVYEFITACPGFIYLWKVIVCVHRRVKVWEDRPQSFEKPGTEDFNWKCWEKMDRVISGCDRVMLFKPIVFRNTHTDTNAGDKGWSVRRLVVSWPECSKDFGFVVLMTLGDISLQSRL